MQSKTSSDCTPGLAPNILIKNNPMAGFQTSHGGFYEDCIIDGWLCHLLLCFNLPNLDLVIANKISWVWFAPSPMEISNQLKIV